MMTAKTIEAHWQRVYADGKSEASKWHQAVPQMSLDLIEHTGIDPMAPLIDVGGGSSRLVDHLLDRGHADVTVLDVSEKGIELARERLEHRAELVEWICEDVTAMIPERQYALWHDRALFHFMQDPVDRALYAAVLYEAVQPGGWVVIGTFAPDGPDSCSGLPTCRYDGSALSQELGRGFALVEERREMHRTPGGETQRFAWSVFRRAQDLI